MKTLRTYSIGFGISLLLTLGAFGLLQEHLNNQHTFPPHSAMVPILVALALAQLLVQLIFFLHLGDEDKPRWNLTLFAFALIIVAILVGGTLWIMHTLAHSQMQEQPDVRVEENIFPQPPDE
ncbi:cytochrome o ubiquinol oxidase subunit IV [Candidatus Kaiserbacteria bacterium]|nr:cytochrome o ubiquinol oxidase subunit IV [Candidatus Kaiserbacteria bacterium]